MTLRARIARLAVPALGLVLAWGCGARFDLPTEVRGRTIPPDSSYGVYQTWTGLTGINDILLTQGAGSQLFMLFNTWDGVTHTTDPRGAIFEYPLVRPEPYPGRVFQHLFNPVALCAGNNRIFVLDQGDTLLAHTRPGGGVDVKIWDLSTYWRVREYGLLAGDTISTFTDTTMAYVTGVAADAQNNVYVGGVAIIMLPNPDDIRYFFRVFQYRINKYSRGPRYPGVVPADRNMPGADWHRDTTFTIEEGSGIGSVVDPRGMVWSGVAGNALYAADHGKNWVQKLADQGLNQGYYFLDGAQTGTILQGPLDVAVDREGFVYLVDGGGRRVLRYDRDATFIQRVDEESEKLGQPLVQPVTVAVDDSTAYVGDRANGRVIWYKRRK